MLNLIITAVLYAAPNLPIQPESAPPIVFAKDEKKDEDKKEEPKLDPEQLKATVEMLKDAFKKGQDVEVKLEAINAALDFPHEDVASALSKGFKDKEHEVVIATIVAMAKLKIPSALEELVSAHKRERGIKKVDEQFGALLKAIGSYGDPDNVDLLCDDLLQNTHKDVLRARVFGLGNTRCQESVEELINIMASASRKKIQPHMDKINLALAALTGNDEGKSQDRWTTWWNDNKRDIKISKEMAPLSKKMQATWNQYWGIYEEEERETKREDRGGG
jgi:hypothetical protein